jgi:hypothetical protein
MEWRVTTPFEEDPDSTGVRELYCQLLSSATGYKLQDRRVEATWHLLRGVTLPKQIARAMNIEARTADGYLRDARGFFDLSTNEELCRRLWALYSFCWGKPNPALAEKFGEQYDDLAGFPSVPGRFTCHGLELTIGELRLAEVLRH